MQACGTQIAQKKHLASIVDWVAVKALKSSSHILGFWQIINNGAAFLQYLTKFLDSNPIELLNMRIF